MNGDATLHTGTTSGHGLSPGSGFDAPLLGVAARLCTEDGREVALAVRRWHQLARGSDHWLLERCQGPTVDLGCGPGRLLAWLLDHGIKALGVDVSPYAGKACLPRRDVVVHRDVFDVLPGEGSWSHVLLADGNIGIGGDPVALLTRCARLLSGGGSVLVELDPADRGLWCGSARVHTIATAGTHTAQSGPCFRWARVGRDALSQVAGAAGLRIADHQHGRRCFAELRPTPG